jgi:2-C-methyl-D-erythritol 4-phosphate cytidylyltransferase
VIDAQGRGRAALVVLAGGSGSRLGAPVNKVYLPLGGHPVLAWSLRWAAQVADVGRIVVVSRPGDDALTQEALRSLEAETADDVPWVTPWPGPQVALPPVDLVSGGPSRHASEGNGLRRLAPQIRSGEIDVVAVHDGARPLAGPGLLRQVLATARRVGGAVPGVPAAHLLEDDRHPGVRTQGGAWQVRPSDAASQRLVRVQTPQAFRARELLAAFDAADAAGFEGTDTAATAQAYGRLTVRLVPGTARNVKVTYPADLALAERLLAADGVHAG